MTSNIPGMAIRARSCRERQTSVRDRNKADTRFELMKAGYLLSRGPSNV
jgi:hypothetical protein